MGKYEIKSFERGYLVLKKENGFIYDICETKKEAQKIKDTLEKEILLEESLTLDV